MDEDPAAFLINYLILIIFPLTLAPVGASPKPLPANRNLN